MTKIVQVCSGTEELEHALAEIVIRVFEEWRIGNGTDADQLFYIALSGGSLPVVLARLADQTYRSRIEWNRCRFYFADERCVPLDHEDSNYKACWDAFLSKIDVAEENVIGIDSEKEPHECAKLYAERMKHIPLKNGFPSFDLILLGMGPDGHTASLFPGHALLGEESVFVAAIDDSPKPPPCRVTLTLPVINSSSSVVFVTGGSGKADVVAKILEEGNTDFPAGMVNPSSGNLVWLLDEGSAEKLQKNDCALN